jgi:serine/threonine protein kinase
MTEISDSFRARFEFKKELGKGGMGEVCLAHDAFQQRDETRPLG